MSALPQQATVKVYKRYSSKYKTFKGTIRFSQLERQPITLQTQ
jgi:hypothetical protein